MVMSDIASGRAKALQKSIIDAYIKGVEWGVGEARLRVMFGPTLDDPTIKTEITKRLNDIYY